MDTPDAEIIREFGQPITHTPLATGVPTQCLACEWVPHPDIEVEPGVSLILFSTMIDGGFVSRPMQNDTVLHRGRSYRVLSTGADSPQGVDASDGIFINCVNR